MSGGDASLILRDAEQMSLLDIPAQVMQSLEVRGTYTAERYQAAHPDAYRIIVALLADGGLGQHRIAELIRSSGTPCSVNTVTAIRDREPDLIERAQKQIAMICKRGARLSVEAIVDRLGDPDLLKEISVSQLAVVAGILTDKAQLLSGGPTSRLEVSDRRATREEYEAFIQAARDAQADPPAYADPMGSVGGNRGQKELVEGGAAGAVDGQAVCDPDGGDDVPHD